MALRYIDGFMGFVVGDAMGFPLKSKSRAELLQEPITKMIANEEQHTPIGTWGEATSMLISTIDSINNKNDVDLNDIALNFLAYKNHSKYTSLHEVINIEDVTKEALNNYDIKRNNPLENGLTTIDSNTNGSLMRILPIAYFAVEKKLKDFEVLELVRNVSSITHAHEISIMGCYIFTRLAMFLLNGKDKLSAYSMTKCVDYSMFDDNTQEEYKRLIKDDIIKLTIKDIKSSNDIVDTLEASIWLLLKSENYKEAIIGAINLGGDTDIIGALTGALAGIIHGNDSIPKNWSEKILRKEYLMDIFEEFSENKYE